MQDATHEAAIKMFLARQRLVHDWMERVLGDPLIPSARRLEPFRLRDYVPRFIDASTEALRRDRYDDEIQKRAVQFARVHAVDRLDAGFTLDEVRRELDHLEAVLTAHIAPPAAMAIVTEALDEARATVDAAYGQSRFDGAAGASLPPVATAARGNVRPAPRRRPAF